MRRLIERGLMFGNLVPVDSPVLVERYMRALDHLTGRRADLDEFHVDISGYSPEVGDALDDPLYLNPDGVNRSFILLTTEQKRAPLLGARFSTSRGILRQFVEANETALLALTARDAVAGELADTVFRCAVPADLFKIGRVTVEADTTAGTVVSARRLEELIARFRTEPDGWWDDVLIARMIELAGETGDLTRNPVALPRMTFAQDNYWTALFGGVYLLRDAPHPVLIHMAEGAFGGLPVPAVAASDRTALAQALTRNGLVEGIVEARGADAAAILRQKMDYIVAFAVAEQGESLAGAGRRDLRRLARRHAGALPPEWHALAALVRWAENAGDWPRITSDDPAYFYTLRAAPGPDRDLVNRLLAELTPMDARQLFICHKEAFYAAWRTWPEGQRAFVADLLAEEYLLDKAGTRAALFGPEPGMEEPPAPPPPTPGPRAAQDRIAAVGPWGALRR
ncbi:DUF6638 family protein [Wenxinia saemankumensis]|uniref:Uncharacterized protein n=1 Tax=Wenxinia saemankumensis TaxID=1447782 RepID=A0A1M6C1I1_9RHOB|nr:DUF6638 family protein [Wenxinia saemankumensis]SHI54860.1 hypothetical protein SAMN05444417_0957 [Wenxinia saemankumensis]